MTRVVHGPNDLFPAKTRNSHGWYSIFSYWVGHVRENWLEFFKTLSFFFLGFWGHHYGFTVENSQKVMKFRKKWKKWSYDESEMCRILRLVDISKWVVQIVLSLWHRFLLQVLDRANIPYCLLVVIHFQEHWISYERRILTCRLLGAVQVQVTRSVINELSLMV